MVILLHGSTQVFEGHPFLVEAGVSMGGKDVKPVCSNSIPDGHNNCESACGAQIFDCYLFLSP